MIAEQAYKQKTVLQKALEADIKELPSYNVPIKVQSMIHDMKTVCICRAEDKQTWSFIEATPGGVNVISDFSIEGGIIKNPYFTFAHHGTGIEVFPSCGPVLGVVTGQLLPMNYQLNVSDYNPIQIRYDKYKGEFNTISSPSYQVRDSNYLLLGRGGKAFILE